MGGSFPPTHTSHDERKVANKVCSVFLISLYGAPLAQSASYLALQSSLFGPDGAVSYDYDVTNSIKSLLIGSRCIPIGTHTNHF